MYLLTSVLLHVSLHNTNYRVFRSRLKAMLANLIEQYRNTLRRMSVFRIA